VLAREQNRGTLAAPKADNFIAELKGAADRGRCGERGAGVQRRASPGARSDAIIADTTGGNPNVFYEIGYAHALHKTTILIGRKGQPLPFDIQSMNLILYDDVVELRERLENRIKGTVLMEGTAPSVA
jgi:hypothetical protein